MAEWHTNNLTSNVGKVFEKIVNERVIQNLPFSEEQAGGRPNRSTIDQIFSLKEVVKQRSSEIKPTYCAFIDIQKTYDKVWRDIIFKIILDCGIRGKI